MNETRIFEAPLKKKWTIKKQRTRRRHFHFWFVLPSPHGLTLKKKTTDGVQSPYNFSTVCCVNWMPLASAFFFSLFPPHRNWLSLSIFHEISPHGCVFNPSWNEEAAGRLRPLLVKLWSSSSKLLLFYWHHQWHTTLKIGCPECFTYKKKQEIYMWDTEKFMVDLC